MNNFRGAADKKIINLKLYYIMHENFNVFPQVEFSWKH